MIHKNNDPTQGYFVVNQYGLSYHEACQKVKAHERLATEDDIAAATEERLIRCGYKPAPPDAPTPAIPDLSALVSIKAAGTVE